MTNNDLTVLSVTYPEKGLLEKQEAARAQALADKKASLSKEEIKALVEDTKAFDTRIDADDSVKAAIVSKVKGVTLKELPEDIPDVKLTSKTNDKNVRTITARTDIDGIGKTMIALDISDLSIEEAMWVQLYAGLMFEADTFDHKASELKDMRDISLMNFYSGIGTCISKDKTDFTPALYVTWQSLDEDIDESFDVFGEVLTKTKTNQRARIVRAIENSKAGIKNELITGGKQTIKYGGISSKSGDNNYMYRVQGLEYYKFLDDVSAKLDSDPSYVIENLKNARKNLANSYGATFGYAGGANGIAAFEKRSAAFADSLANTPKTKAKYDKAALSDAYTVNSGANFNYKFMNYEDLGLGDITPEQIAEFDVVASMLSDAYTLPYLRNYYGAYGAYVDNTDNGIVFWTYRDPNIAETYAVYDALPEFLDTFEVDQETLDGYIMAQYSNLVQSSGNLSDAELTLNYAFDDRDINAEVAASLKALKKLTPERVNEIKAYYAKVAKEGRICTVGTAASVQANKDAFGKVENPFSE